jgi:uncharacterized protein (TIGR02996 family)
VSGQWNGYASPVRAWLEREAPEGDRITLPDGSGSMVFGRSSKCTLVFDDISLSARHCEVAWDSGFWKLRDLGSELGTKVNGQPLTHARALFTGDRIEFGSVRLRFCTDIPLDDPQLLDAIARSPESESNWLVYADQLQERGDPLGERIARSRSGGRLDHMPWLGPLWDSFVRGELEIEWEFGFVKRAAVRTAAGRLPAEWRSLVSTLLNLRVGRFLRHLVIDLPRLENLTPLQIPQEVVAAQHFLATLPALPTTLEKLSFGYHVSQPVSGSLSVTEELALRLPRLRNTPVYQRVQGVRLRVVSVADGVKLTGIEGNRVLTGVTRIRRGNRNQLFLESAPGMAFMADGDPCFFSFTDGRPKLISGRMRGEVRVNNRIDSLYELLPDDVIDVLAGGKFRLEVVA